MSKIVVPKRSPVRKLVLAAAGIVALTASVMVCALHAPGLLAQAPVGPIPKYEVISIRPCDLANPPAGRSGGGGASPGRLHVSCNTLENLIQEAYRTYARGLAFYGFVSQDSLNPIEGGPAWIKTARYDINASAPGNPSIPMMRGPMMQALLEDRFKLKLRREIREVSVYRLTVAKSGLKLKMRDEGSCILPPGTRPSNALR